MSIGNLSLDVTASGCSAAVAHMLWEPAWRGVSGAGLVLPSTLCQAAKATIIVRFAGAADIGFLLTRSALSVYCLYSPGGFARRAFCIPPVRGQRVKVRVYVDGFNLYYGALRARPAFRWLDLLALSQIIRPSDTIDAVRYFTARVKGDQDPTAPGRQKLYLKAISTLPAVTIHLGQFRTHPVRMPLANAALGQTRTAQVLKTEEKGSDVNLATFAGSPRWTLARG